LTKNFGSENVNESEVFEVSSWQKETVLKRLNEYKKIQHRH
jgi:hypothetical protein